MHLFRRMRLFCRIVFRVWDCQDDIVIRLWPSLAWEVSGIIHPGKDRK